MLCTCSLELILWSECNADRWYFFGMLSVLSNIVLAGLVNSLKFVDLLILNIACPTILIVILLFIYLFYLLFSNGFMLFKSRQHFLYLDESANWPSLLDVLVTMQAPGRSSYRLVFSWLHHVLSMGMDTHIWENHFCFIRFINGIKFKYNLLRKHGSLFFNVLWECTVYDASWTQTAYMVL
jgi:hypothetical protein